MENAAVNPRFEEILSLSVRERLKLLRAIVESLEADEDDRPRDALVLSKAQLRELERRRRAYLRDPSAARTWEEVDRDLRRRRGRFASVPKRKRT